MIPAINKTEPVIDFQPEVMSINEDALFLDCAWQMLSNIEEQIKNSRNLLEINNLKMHKEVVSNMIENFNRNQMAAN